MISISTQRDAFVPPAWHRERVQALNEAVLADEIVPITGASGSGKHRFLHWWWQTACADPRIVGTQSVQPEEIIFIKAQSLLRSGVPTISIIFTKLLGALQELDCLSTEHRLPHRSGPVRSWYSKRQLASLIHEVVFPLFAQIQPQAMVITNAQELDHETLSTLLDLRRMMRQGQQAKPLCALILCARVEEGTAEESPFYRLLQHEGETRAAWNAHMAITKMTVREFGETMRTIIKENLSATFAPNIDIRQALISFGTWTDANWWLIEQLTRKLDLALGPILPNQPRVITQDVLNQVQKIWTK